MKLSILYYSKTGRTRDTALAIQRGAEKIEGMEAKAFPLDEIDEDFLKESRAVGIWNTNLFGQHLLADQKWFDESLKIQAGRESWEPPMLQPTISRGGADTAIMNIVGHMLVKGMMVYSGGSALGQPSICIWAPSL